MPHIKIYISEANYRKLLKADQYYRDPRTHDIRYGRFDMDAFEERLSQIVASYSPNNPKVAVYWNTFIRGSKDAADIRLEVVQDEGGFVTITQMASVLSNHLKEAIAKKLGLAEVVINVSIEQNLHPNGESTVRVS